MPNWFSLHNSYAVTQKQFPLGRQSWIVRLLLFFDEETKLFYSPLQTEEDYIPYPSVHEVWWWACAAVAPHPHTLFESSVLLQYCPQITFHVYTILFLNPSFFVSRGRFWEEKAPFLSSSCLSLGVTGLKGLTMSWVTQWRASSCSRCRLTAAPSWNVTQPLQSTGRTSSARLATFVVTYIM